jgi:hypothetical protein
VDGAHIAALLITFFYRSMPETIRQGRLFMALPPLYRISAGPLSEYARDDVHRDELLATVFKGKKVEIGRFKGLGEMMASQLKETTMDPKKRTLARVTVPASEDDIEDLVERLMGKKAEARYQFIQENAEFAADDQHHGVLGQGVDAGGDPGDMGLDAAVEGDRLRAHRGGFGRDRRRQAGALQGRDHDVGEVGVAQGGGQGAGAGLARLGQRRVGVETGGGIGLLGMADQDDRLGLGRQGADPGQQAGEDQALHRGFPEKTKSKESKESRDRTLGEKNTVQRG